MRKVCEHCQQAGNVTGRGRRACIAARRKKTGESHDARRITGRAALICLGLCLPIAVGRAEDTGDATSASIARQAGRNDGGTGSSGGVEKRRSWADQTFGRTLGRPASRFVSRSLAANHSTADAEPKLFLGARTRSLKVRGQRNGSIRGDPASLRGNQLARKPPDRKSRRTLGRDGMFD